MQHALKVKKKKKRKIKSKRTDVLK